VTSETFLRVVEGLSGLRDPAAFKGWLYAIARNAALRSIDQRKRAVPVDEHDESAATVQTSAVPTPETRTEQTELRALFDKAASTMSERDRTVYDLAVRHGLSSAEIARALDVRPAYAYILVNRLKTSVTEAVEAAALARVGRDACAALAGLVQGSDVDSPRLRKAVARHARTCKACAETKRRRASLPAMFEGVAFAQPGASFAASLAARIDEAWDKRPTSGPGAASAALGGVIGGLAIVLVLAVSVTGLAAQRTIVRHEVPAPAHQAPVAAVQVPKPAPAAVVGPAGSDNQPAVSGQTGDVAGTGGNLSGADPRVVVTNSSDGGDNTAGSSTTSNSSSAQTGNDTGGNGGGGDGSCSSCYTNP
jgi:RNA polymerase sigma factor (sigma-70 family)